MDLINSEFDEYKLTLNRSHGMEVLFYDHHYVKIFGDFPCLHLKQILRSSKHKQLPEN